MANPLEQFNLYADAANADRYRVTSIKLLDAGGQKTFILDKRDGVTLGFTPAELRQHIPEMLRLQYRGENLYLTPLSSGRHHFLIDDMDREKLRQLIHDGYKPAAVIESSPDNYQAILTIQKLGTAHDKDVGNRLTEHLNRNYGDPKLSGAVHPHRFPGFQNRKPKHRRADGSFPEVRLLRSERRECEKAFELSRQIDSEYQLSGKKSRPHQSIANGFVATDTRFLPPPLSQIYEIHRADILSRWKGEVDCSRLDHMISVRMFVCGHSTHEIESTLLACAQSSRPPEKGGTHNWADYSKRTALSAGLRFEKHAQWVRHWLELEKRAGAGGVS